jgi:hypothetical protein
MRTLGRLINRNLTQSEIIYHLVRLDQEYTARPRKLEWAPYYGKELAAAYQPTAE